MVAEGGRPRVPSGTGAAGARLWKSVVAGHELDEHELLLLREAARTADLLDELVALAAEAGPLLDGPGGPRMHPALVEGRQQRIVLARLLAALRVPAVDEDRRPQRRGGARGVYGLRGVS